MNISKILKSEILWVTLILTLAFVVRLYKIDSPIADWHSWRQADTAAVARNFYQDGFNPFVPKYDDFSGVAEKPIINPNRYRFVEFPIYNSLVYFSYLINGGVDEELARLTNVFISLGSLVFLYLLTKRYSDKLTAAVAALIFAALPFNIYFSRVILPDPILVFFTLGAVYLTDRWIFENKKSLMITSVLMAASAFLTKPYAAFYFLPLLYSFIRKEGRIWPIPSRYFIWGLSAILPFVFWRFWINQHPEGIPASGWLLNGNQIRFKPVFWQWILGDRFSREILGVTGTILFFIGILKKPDPKQGIFLHLFGLGAILFLIVFATGNVQHDYYQTFIIPALAIFAARGFVLLLKGIPGFLPKIWTAPLALLLFFLMFYMGWGQVKGLYQINNGAIVEAGIVANKILPKEAIVVAPYQGDTSFLYQINRPGFPSVPLPLPELIEKYHVTHYVSTAKDSKTSWVMRKYSLMVENPKFIIVDLTHPKANFDDLSDPEPNFQ